MHCHTIKSTQKLSIYNRFKNNMAGSIFWFSNNLIERITMNDEGS